MPRILHLRPRFGASLLALLFLGSSATGAAAQADPDALPAGAVPQLIGDRPVMQVAWIDQTRQAVNPGWVFHVTVNAQGRVTDVKPVDGPIPQRREAMRMVQALRFLPFKHEGVATSVQFDYVVPAQTPDYAGPPSREFPPTVQPAQVRIALSRSLCLRTCPAYRVELHGDGTVNYEGMRHVAVPGRHRWRVSPGAVAKLVEQFRAAGYFKLAGDYSTNVPDQPIYITRLSLGAQQKTVTSDGLNTNPGKPAVVTALEQAVDATAGITTWVQGDEHTLAALRAAHWDFRRPAATQGLRHLIDRCQVDVAVGFLQGGAPWREPGSASAGDAVLDSAARCGSLRLVRELASHGALAHRTQAQSLLETSAESGFPELVRLALDHGADARGRRRGGAPLLFLAGTVQPRNERLAPDALFDPTGVVRWLVAAGADVNARDEAGDTLLESTESEGVALVLLDAGAAWPATPERRAALVERATALKWATWLARLPPAEAVTAPR